MMQELEQYLLNIKKSKPVIATMSDKDKKNILHKIADELIKNTDEIIKQNNIDIQNGKENNLSSALMDRLLLDKTRIKDMANSLIQIASLKNPVNKIIDGWDVQNSMLIQKVSVPIGVIGVIYESRPNVTSDVAGLCIKSGNVAILKGGKEAYYSNMIIIKIIQQTLSQNDLPTNIVSSFIDSSREGVKKMITLDKDIDLIIPRGGSSLIEFVNTNSTVPVVKHDRGVCHTFVDKFADIKKAIDITINAKTRRVGVCNAMECMLVHKDIAKDFLISVKVEFDKKQTILKGCKKTIKILNIEEANEEDFYKEYLANILNIKIVSSNTEAIEHIGKYGSSHSDAIISENYTNTNEFCNLVDSACVYVNASTAFTDGGEFGFGAEVGISTNKLHSRGPMGIEDLTTYKFKILGNGQIRN
jgi:glutamate-5-semialdehyde dehydrogenase